jgi:hypothetical protein
MKDMFENWTDDELRNAIWMDKMASYQRAVIRLNGTKMNYIEEPEARKVFMNNHAKGGIVLKLLTCTCGHVTRVKKLYGYYEGTCEKCGKRYYYSQPLGKWLYRFNLRPESDSQAKAPVSAFTAKNEC